MTLLVLFAVPAVAAPSPAIGSEPTPAPPTQSAPPTCAERYPAEGPAGVDLRLGCIVGELIGLYTPDRATAPAPLSSYAIAVGLLGVGGLVAFWFAGRLLAQRAGRRLAPVLPGAWWVCAACRSLNGTGVVRCYACGAGRPDAPTLPTDPNPGIPQSFGERRKRG